MNRVCTGVATVVTNVRGGDTGRFLRSVLGGLLGGLLAASTALASGPIPVSIERTEQGFQLLRGGEPYAVHGAGAAFEGFELLAQHGGNSVRTWHVEEDVATGIAVLDKAHELGLTVSLCLNIARERQGFDYDDPIAVAAQLERAREAILAYRHHPALLTWIIGNELNYDYQNPAVFDAVDDIAKMIHELDPHHPATTAIAGFSKDMVRVINERAPNLDLISFQMYADLINLPRYLQEIGFNAPYFVTEWGAIGHWEVGKTEWGAPIEQNSTQKAANYQKSYDQVIAADAHRALGNFVFFWGQKQERTPTWYGLFTETGEATEAVDVMTRIWSGQWPENRSPRIEAFELDQRGAFDNIRLKPGERHRATARVIDPNGDDIVYHWGIKPESDSQAHGGDAEDHIDDIPGLIKQQGAATVTFVTPATPGAYRLFMYAYDGRGKAAHGNIPFHVDARASAISSALTIPMTDPGTAPKKGGSE